MTHILELQLSKAISQNIVTRQDASFVMKLVNECDSIGKALECMLHYSGKTLQDFPIILPDYSIRAHTILSSEIIKDISDIQITEEELNSMIDL